MKVKWTETTPLSSIPETYWGEDLSLLDRHYEGDVIGSNRTFFGYTYLIVACTDGKVREVEIDKCSHQAHNPSLIPNQAGIVN